MPEISEFSGIDFSNFDENAAKLKVCLENHHLDEGQNCSNCKSVAGCALVKSFVLSQFDLNKQKLALCQEKNGFKGCFDCASFFECSIRRDYVRSTYEKMNEGRGGEFDF